MDELYYMIIIHNGFGYLNEYKTKVPPVSAARHRPGTGAVVTVKFFRVVPTHCLQGFFIDRVA